ncbi:slc1p [Saccharomyces arboricola H-6]|uniref:1-acyl-sn-glycerol-3-phosphate acyltransferase n=1 Tax=Saccharomyces arboricola (strain H-6 / AS 2.3317 / CBS 10644) TaxID=1160507 RepID=J8LQJ4_SACAR|nr:slc1p [Saccharomyces arboricola H-6]
MSVPAKFLYCLRSVLVILALSSCGLYGVIASIFCTLIGKRYLAQWTTARCFYHVMKLLLGLDVKVVGEENLTNKPFVIIANHQSTLDIFMLGRIFPPGCTVTAKKSLKWVPFLGWFMALSGTYFLDRSKRKESIETLNRGMENVRKNKRVLWVFPEGTRSYTSELTMLPFKKGAFHLAQQGKIPIVPVVVSNTSTLVSPKYGVFNRGCMIVKILKPISTENLTKDKVGEFAEKVRDQMIDTLKEIGYSPAHNDTNLPPQAVEYAALHDKTKNKMNNEPVSSVGVSDGVSIHHEGSSMKKMH